MARAACRGVPPGAWWTEHNPDIFFPGRGRLDDVDKARWSCFVCPVQQECIQYREETKSEYGMWAGKFGKAEIEEVEIETWHEFWYLYLDLVPERIAA